MSSSPISLTSFLFSQRLTFFLPMTAPRRSLTHAPMAKVVYPCDQAHVCPGGLAQWLYGDVSLSFPRGISDFHT